MPEDADNILRVAMNRLINGVKIKQAASIFAGQNTITALTYGSATAKSADVQTIMLWDEWIVRNRELNKRHSCRFKPTGKAQISLLF
jgi:hypothetical protein